MLRGAIGGTPGALPPRGAAISFRGTMTTASTLARAASLIAVVSCGGTAPVPPPVSTAPAPAQGAAPAASADAAATVTPMAGVLGRFAALNVIVLPTQSVGSADLLGWRASSGGERVLIAALDAGIEAALGERALTTWVYSSALQRAARRNPTYVTDPAAVRALGPVRAVMRKPDDSFAEPFASQLRSLAGVSDGRYALIPLELRLEPILNGTSGRAVLQVAMVDARASRVVWVGEVAGDPHAAYGPAVLASLARRVADLVVPRSPTSQP